MRFDRTTLYQHDTFGQPTHVTLPGGAEIATSYDPDGNVEAVTDARLHTTTADHDALGRLVEQTDPDGNVTRFSYDAADRLLKRVDPPAKPGDPAGEVILDYDARGDLRSITDPEGHATLFEHDRHHRQSAVQDPTGRRSTSTYDTENNLTSSTSAWGATTTYGYDTQRRMIKVTAADGTAEGAITRYAYTPTGRTASITDAANHSTEFDYDAAGRMVETTDAAGQSARYEYSQRDELIASIDPADIATRYEYDLAGQLTATVLDRPTPAADPTWHWTYTLAGDRQTMTDPDTRVTSYTHDASGNMTAVDYPGQTADTTLAYDTAGNVSQATNPLGTTELHHDALNRLTQEQLPGARSTARAYDLAGNLTGLTLPGGDERSFEYDAADRVVSVTGANGRTEYDYDSGGRLDALRLPRPGERTDYDYDPLGRVTNVANWRGTGQLIDELSYGYDKASNITSIESPDDHATFAYDGLDRLTEESHSSATPLTQSFTYDPTGNRLTATSDAQSTSYDYDDLGRLTQAGATAYGYNDTGELQDATTGGQTTAYTWTPTGQLAAVDLPGAAPDVSFAYDPFQRRTQITRNGETTERLFVGDEIAQTDDGTTTRRFIRDPANRLLATSSADDHRSYHLDALGSVHAIVKADGTIADRFSYTAFGAPRETAATTAQPYGYLAQEYDAQTGLHDFRARAYDSTTGRFTSRDPIAGRPEVPQSLNPYQYAYNNPLANTDTSGESSVPGLHIPNVVTDVAGITVGAAADGALGNSGPYICGICNYLIARPDDKPFSWLAFGLAGIGDLPPGKILKAGGAANKGARALWPAGKGVSTADKASELRALAGRNRVSIDTPSGRLTVDLEGKSHFDKTLGRSVDTPHVKFETRHVGPDGRVSYTSGSVREATQADLRLVGRVLAERGR